MSASRERGTATAARLSFFCRRRLVSSIAHTLVNASSLAQISLSDYRGKYTVLVFFPLACESLPLHRAAMLKSHAVVAAHTRITQGPLFAPPSSTRLTTALTSSRPLTRRCGPPLLLPPLRFVAFFPELIFTHHCLRSLRFRSTLSTRCWHGKFSRRSVACCGLDVGAGAWLPESVAA